MSGRVEMAVVGVGAIGGVVAAALADAGHEAALCVRTPFEGLERTYDGDTRRYANPVHTDPSALGPVDWVMLCTKAHQIEGAAPWLERLVGPATRVAVMQNGVDHVERLARLVPAGQVVPCIMMLPAEARAPGTVAQARAGSIAVPAGEASEELAALFGSGGAIAVQPVDDFVSAVWAKLVLNTVGGAICGLALAPLGAVAAPEARDLAVALMREVIAVGRAEGAVFADDFIERSLEALGTTYAGHWTSLAVDRREGRTMEWEARNAVVGRTGRRHGIATPLNDAMTALLALVDSRIAANVHA